MTKPSKEDATPNIDWRVSVYETVESTQTHVFEKVAEDEPEGFVVQGLQQVGGKGRHGNQWTSPIGNLYMSMLLRPDCTMMQAGEMAFVIGVALSEAMNPYIDPNKHNKQLKWPNDILVDGLKISGILIEADSNDKGGVNALVVGMGINIFIAPDLAVSISKISEKPIYINVFRDEVLASINRWYKRWTEKGFAPIRDAWLKQAYGIGDEITARLPNDKIKGVFKSIDEQGALILEMPDGSDKIIHAADVHFGPKEQKKK